MQWASAVLLSHLLTFTHHTAASFQVTLVLNLEMSSLHGPVLMWHGMLDIMTHQVVSIGQIYSSCSRNKRKQSDLVTFWKNNNAKTVTKKGCCLAALTGGWNRDGDALDGCNNRKGATWFQLPAGFHVSLQRGSLCWDHNPGIHMLNKRNWRKKQTTQ